MSVRTLDFYRNLVADLWNDFIVRPSELAQLPRHGPRQVARTPAATDNVSVRFRSLTCFHVTSVFLFVSSLKLRRIHFPYILLTGHTWPRQSSGGSQGLAPNRWSQPSLVPTSGTDTFPGQDVEHLRPTLCVFLENNR